MTVRAAGYGSTSITGVDELWRITAISRAASQCIFMITLVFVNWGLSQGDAYLPFYSAGVFFRKLADDAESAARLWEITTSKPSNVECTSLMEGKSGDHRREGRHPCFSVWQRFDGMMYGEMLIFRPMRADWFLCGTFYARGGESYQNRISFSTYKSPGVGGLFSNFLVLGKI